VGLREASDPAGALRRSIGGRQSYPRWSACEKPKRTCWDVQSRGASECEASLALNVPGDDLWLALDGVLDLIP